MVLGPGWKTHAARVLARDEVLFRCVAYVTLPCFDKKYWRGKFDNKSWRCDENRRKNKKLRFQIEWRLRHIVLQRFDRLTDWQTLLTDFTSTYRLNHAGTHFKKTVSFDLFKFSLKSVIEKIFLSKIAQMYATNTEFVPAVTAGHLFITMYRTCQCGVEGALLSIARISVPVRIQCPMGCNSKPGVAFNYDTELLFSVSGPEFGAWIFSSGNWSTRNESEFIIRFIYFWPGMINFETSAPHLQIDGNSYRYTQLDSWFRVGNLSFGCQF